MKRAFLLGPTASGKTRVALALAPELDAEILSMDSMLVYRGMNLGTAKPTPEEQAGVPHHLLDLVAPAEEFSVARWLAAAQAVEQDLAGRGKHALYVGGTNLYLKALTSGLLAAPPIPPALRAAVEQEGRSAAGLERLFAELQEVDPASAARIHRNDRQRLVRAIELYRATGRPLSLWQQEWSAEQPLKQPAVALEWPREELRARVAQRFDQMLEQGFVAEVRAIRETGGFGRTAAKGLGYRQVLDYLDGHCTLDEARERAITATRTYIRRQMTWLRSFPDLHWVSMCDDAGRPRPTAELTAACLAAFDSDSLGRPTPHSAPHD